MGSLAQRGQGNQSQRLWQICRSL